MTTRPQAMPMQTPTTPEAPAPVGSGRTARKLIAVGFWLAFAVAVTAAASRRGEADDVRSCLPSRIVFLHEPNGVGSPFQCLLSPELLAGRALRAAFCDGRLSRCGAVPRARGADGTTQSDVGLYRCLYVDSDSPGRADLGDGVQLQMIGPALLVGANEDAGVRIFLGLRLTADDGNRRKTADASLIVREKTQYAVDRCRERPGQTSQWNGSQEDLDVARGA